MTKYDLCAFEQVICDLNLEPEIVAVNLNLWSSVICVTCVHSFIYSFIHVYHWQLKACGTLSALVLQTLQNTGSPCQWENDDSLKFIRLFFFFEGERVEK